MFELFFCHWYASGGVPLAATKNVAVDPTEASWLCGFSVITGAPEPV
jgi:hypothetical protein